MSAEWLAFGAVICGNVAALVWGASRVSTTVDRISVTVDNLDKTLDKLADSVNTESRVNAAQDARLDSHDRQLDQHAVDITELRRLR